MERALQRSGPLARRAEAALGVRGRSLDQRARFECAVTTLCGFASGPQRDVAGADKFSGRDAHDGHVQERPRLDVEAQQRLGRGASRPLQRT